MKLDKLSKHSLKTLANNGKNCRGKTRIVVIVSFHGVSFLLHTFSLLKNLRGKMILSLAHKKSGVYKETENQK